eukprot:3634427-Amphidinium_carterae.1
MTYVQEPASSVVNDRVEKHIDTKAGKWMWMVEAALWSSWIHVGTMSANEPCEVLSLHAESMSEILGIMHTLMKDILMDYCYAFHRRLQAAKPPYAPWPNDLEVPFTSFGEIAISMRSQLRITLCKDVLDMASGKVNKLDVMTEVGSGLSSMVLDEKGIAHRVTSIVCARIVRKSSCPLP